MSNAVKAKSWPKKFFPAYSVHGGPPLMDEIATDPDGTIAIEPGDPLEFTATGNGSVIRATATSGMIHGVAAEGATVAEQDDAKVISFWPAVPETVFRGQSEGKTDANDIGDVCDIEVSGTNWLINEDANTEDVVRIVALTPGDSITDDTDPGRYDFVWNRSSYPGPVILNAAK